MRVLFMLLILMSCQQSSEKEIDTFFERLSVLTLKKQVINSNIQNAQTTRTAKGGAYIPKIATNCKNGRCEILDFKSHQENYSPILKYEPSHPDAKKNGYVEYPNLNINEEMEKLIKITRATEFLLEASPVAKSFFYSKQIRQYLEKYPVLKDQYDFENILRN